MRGLPGIAALVVATLMLAAACGEKMSVPYDTSVTLSPDSLIPPQKMALILSDVHLAEAGLTYDRNRNVAPGSKPGFLYDGIYRKHHITGELYAKNLRYYTANPETYVKVYEQVIAILEKKKPGNSAPPAR